MRQAGGRGGPAPVCSDPGPTMVKTTAGQRRLPPVPVCSPLPATNELSAGIASSMDNEANVFDEMETRVTAMSSLPPRASVHCSLSSVTRSRHFVRPWLSAHSGIFSSSGWQRRLKTVSTTLVTRSVLTSRINRSTLNKVRIASRELAVGVPGCLFLAQSQTDRVGPLCMRQ
ncbi:uncharacterized protein [Miscanthus floridulus]|uniref:uncharacterized protein isoform X2 n=1 Tax=Miscanthus floridulus TaxID=154761 RepID=UPI00345B0A2B